MHCVGCMCSQAVVKKHPPSADECGLSFAKQCKFKSRKRRRRLSSGCRAWAFPGRCALFFPWAAFAIAGLIPLILPSRMVRVLRHPAFLLIHHVLLSAGVH